MDSPVHHMTCPKCGASLDPPPGATTLTCKYCNTALRLARDGQHLERAQNNVVVAFVLFILLTVVGGVALGVISGIRAASESKRRTDDALKQAQDVQKGADDMMKAHRMSACAQAAQAMCTLTCQPGGKAKPDATACKTCMDAEVAKCMK